ncbi:hypothetical protein GCM10007320_24000 [Pseudorhodoferax aquiterrae]|uniref:NERD domain-containing protein n=1 Tax=Pseudorhodoferax aquiterrae TaxID=747304 RepID=A0ABQ3G0Q0_9BURK|nr:hypothetical protein GCM10007320_24000 [Pseudorhodoferax aquiterrae]
MTSGERRLAKRLEQQLDEDHLLWYDVPIGPKQTHPDFVVLHPRRGLLILETKDWRLDTIQSATPQRWDILADAEPGAGFVRRDGGRRDPRGRPAADPLRLLLALLA